ncbi:MAG: periplasmic heavy metal sensor [Flavipsychrobacter sp.]|nr:periplasmic heavy metal sensor [Flavipsychrobacter sp.]
MKNERFYQVIIVMLLLLNGGTLAFLLLNRESRPQAQGAHMHEPRGGNPVDRMMRERLGLTEEQEEQFRMLKEEHHEQMKAIQNDEKDLHTRLFLLLKATAIDTVAREALLQQLEANDRRKEEVTFEHFRKLRALLTPGQHPKFDSLVEEIASQILSHRHGRGPRPEGPPPGDRP